MSSTMLRSFSRAAPSSTSLRVHSSRLQIQPAQLPAATCLLEGRCEQRRHAGIHAISNPTLAGIEKRWEAMPPQEQADLWMALRDRMKTDWHEMTLQEKKAGTLGGSWVLARGLTPLVCSVLDCLRSPRPSRPPSAWRRQTSLLVHHARCRYISRPLRHHPSIRPPSAQNYERAIPGHDQ